MAITTMTLDELRAKPSEMDRAKARTTTEADVRRHMIEDGENPADALRKRDIISPAAIRALRR